jgi:hypothetical protein
MHQGRTVFSQRMSFLPDRDFRRVVARYGGDSRLRGFSCWDQFLAMAFAQLTFRESLRDVEACLQAGPSLYHLGLRGKVSRSTLADANEAHDWRIFADFAQILISIARFLYAEEPMGMEFDSTLYALDSTTIDLCLSLFPWAKFRSKLQTIQASAEIASARDRLRCIVVTIAQKEVADIHRVTEKGALVCRSRTDHFLTGFGVAPLTEDRASNQHEQSYRKSYRASLQAL